jgi:hypothetical protein
MLVQLRPGERPFRDRDVRVRDRSCKTCVVIQETPSSKLCMLCTTSRSRPMIIRTRMFYSQWSRHEFLFAYYIQNVNFKDLTPSLDFITHIFKSLMKLGIDVIGFTLPQFSWERLPAAIIR